MANKIYRNLHSISDHVLSYRVCFKCGFNIIVHAYGCIDHFYHIDESFVKSINFIWKNGMIVNNIPADSILSIMLIGYFDRDLDSVIFSDGRLL